MSDGVHCVEVVISTYLTHLVQSGQLEEHTIIKVKTFQYNITEDNIHIISISEMLSEKMESAVFLFFAEDLISLFSSSTAQRHLGRKSRGGHW